MIVGTSTSTMLLRGRISNYRKTRKPQDFLINQSDREQAGLTAIAAALAGSGGAVGLAGMVDTKEQADFVEFEVEGEKVAGWLTWSPFNEGDEIEALVESSQNGYNTFGIRRLNDRIVALHPHCSRGRFSHFKASVKWWLIISSFSLAIGVSIILSFQIFEDGINGKSLLDTALFFGFLGGAAWFSFSGLIAFNISRRFMPFVRLAEAIFEGFGWKDVKNIDLPVISKKDRMPGDGPGMGRLYFRY